MTEGTVEMASLAVTLSGDGMTAGDQVTLVKNQNGESSRKKKRALNNEDKAKKKKKKKDRKAALEAKELIAPEQEVNAVVPAILARVVDEVTAGAQTDVVVAANVAGEAVVSSEKASRRALNQTMLQLVLEDVLQKLQHGELKRFPSGPTLDSIVARAIKEAKVKDPSAKNHRDDITGKHIATWRANTRKAFQKARQKVSDDMSNLESPRVKFLMKCGKLLESIDDCTNEMKLKVPNHVELDAPHAFPSAAIKVEEAIACRSCVDDDDSSESTQPDISNKVAAQKSQDSIVTNAHMLRLMKVQIDREEAEIASRIHYLQRLKDLAKELQ